MFSMMIFVIFMFFCGLIFMLFGTYMYMYMFLFVFDWTIYVVGPLNFSMMIYLDYVSMIFLGVVLIISSMVLLYSMDYMSGDKTIDRLKFLIFLFVLSMCLMILSPNILSILLGWDGLGLISYCLVVYYQSDIAYSSGMLTVLCNRLGDIGLLMLICLGSFVGSWNLMLYNFDNYMLFFIFMAMFTKSAQMPFSSWLPAAMTAPTPVSSLVHSSTLVTAGVYLMIRYNEVLFFFDLYLLIFVSVFTMMMSGLIANFEYDLKKIIALSTLSQLGFMMSIMFFGLVDLAFFHLIVHAMFKSLMFLCVGGFIHSMSDNQDIRNYGGMFYIYPLKSIVMLISLFCLCGIPFLSGFYSKDLIFEYFLVSTMNVILMVMFYMSMIFTVSYSVRLVIWLFLDCYNFLPFSSLKESTLISVSMIILMFMSIFLGCFYMGLIYKSYFFILNSFDKILILKMYLYGMFMGYFFYLNNMFTYLDFINFFVSMYFLTTFFKIFYKSFILNFYNYESWFEKGWYESLSGLSIYKMMYLVKFSSAKGTNFIYIIKIYLYMYLLLLIIY
uniref:NADH-ubiquinone oxidoreductase chain 5 n=1 Tax=Andrena chekiangensis TaxID=2572772 RepID=A0A4D6SS69_9HYME|nr:NADH dehydrogenase subunit 5 [Andrena chekiangensis]QCG69817.1 NADH dehydrogenase subunit 5 [Andrena chekiangensis]